MNNKLFDEPNDLNDVARFHDTFELPIRRSPVIPSKERCDLRLNLIEEELGVAVDHEVRPCTANPVEQSHRRVKHRYDPTLGFGEFEAAQRFIPGQ